MLRLSLCFARVDVCSLSGYIAFGDTVNGNILSSFSGMSDNLMGVVRVCLCVCVPACLRVSVSVSLCDCVSVSLYIEEAM